MALMITKEALLDARKALHENQAEFGKRFGVGQNTIHRWETAGIPLRGAAYSLIERVLADLGRPDNFAGNVSRETSTESVT